MNKIYVSYYGYAGDEHFIVFTYDCHIQVRIVAHHPEEIIEKVNYTIYNRAMFLRGVDFGEWKKRFEQTILRNEPIFNMDVFSSQLQGVYYMTPNKFIPKEDMTCMTNKLQKFIDEMRRGVASTCVRWIGRQIRREWRDLLPLVASILDSRYPAIHK